jgi:hypothetical protein
MLHYGNWLLLRLGFVEGRARKKVRGKQRIGYQTCVIT